MIIFKLLQFPGSKPSRVTRPETAEGQPPHRQKLMLLSLAGQQGPTLAGAILSTNLGLRPGSDHNDFEPFAA